MNPHKCEVFVKDAQGIERCGYCSEAKTSKDATKEQAHHTAALAALELSTSSRALRDARAEAREAHLPALERVLDEAVKEVASLSLRIAHLVK